MEVLECEWVAIIYLLGLFMNDEKHWCCVVMLVKLLSFKEKNNEATRIDVDNIC